MEPWIFCDFRVPMPDAADLWASGISGLGFKRAVIGVGDDIDASFTPRYSVARYLSALGALERHGIAPIIMPWLHRDKAWQHAVRSFVGSLQRPQLEVLFDVEGLWVQTRSVGVEAAVRTFAQTWGDYAGRLGLTAFASLPGSVAALAPHVQYGLPQAYSVYQPGFTTPVYRPRTTQKYAWRRWSPKFDELVFGLAAWAQDHPAPSPQGLEAMTAALDQTVELARQAEYQRLKGTGTTTIYGYAYWSHKHLSPRVKRFMINVNGVSST